MKYAVILGDGMADLPIEAINNKTPLEAALKPNIDKLAKYGTVGMMRTVYEGLAPGSDVANLCVMGFNPKENYSGRSPLEAASIGVELTETDITYRTNLVTLSDEPDYENKTLVDYSAGEISTQEANEIIKTVNEKLGSEFYNFYTSTSYRHLLVRKDMKKAGKLTPPHDISDKIVGEYLPEDAYLKELMIKSYDILKDHPVNKKRISEGKNPANSIWFWGEGTKPGLDLFKNVYGLDASVISAVDLIKGIAKLTNMNVLEVENATGTVHTNFDGKAKAAIEAFKNGSEYVYIHMEAPDESGHQGSLEDKIKSIELIDEKVVGPVYEHLKSCGEDFTILVLPDHPTPVSLKTHTSEPIPFLVYRSSDTEIKDENAVYTENYAKSTHLYLEEGHTLLRKVMNGEI
ncbi:MAG: cofactor-independent phosphoglycerate mutase [Clostridia bacterium]|nr:cofactor-independent phosphoglycerate mutase [Clostridia bacterium]